MAIWKDTGTWVYHQFDPDLNPGDLPEFQQVIELWQSKRKGRLVPSWSDFDFYDFKGWHSRVAIYDIFYNPFNWRIRLSGGTIDQVYGKSMTNTTMEELRNEAIDYDLAAQFYEITCQNLQVTVTHGPPNLKNRDFVEVIFLELPCSDNGDFATHTIEAIHLLRASEKS